MIDTKFIKKDGKPVAAVIDYSMYLEFIEYLEDKEALKAVKEMEDKEWITHQRVKEKLGL